MLLHTKLWQRFRRFRERIQSRKHPSPLAEWLGPGRSPYSEWDMACYGEVITWESYLSQETRNALLELHAVERLCDGLKAFWDWERNQPLRERLRISHFEWTYSSYTLPDSPVFCVWLPREEIRARVFTGPVPPFGAIEYERTKRAAVPDWTTDPSEIADLMFDDECLLFASNRLWRPEHYAAVHFYRTLPYNSAEQQRDGRWVQTDY
jgi:hypothetical protein